MEEVVIMNKVLEHVKITGITQCTNVIQAVMKSVNYHGKIDMKESKIKKKK